MCAIRMQRMLIGKIRAGNMKIVNMKFAAAVITMLVLGVGCQSVKGMFSSADKQEPVTNNASTAPAVATPSYNLNPDTFNGKVTSLSSQLSSFLQNYDLTTHTVVVTTFVDLGHLKGGSRFGRQVSERLVYALHTMGYRVFELRMGKDVSVVENNGEFTLTRKLDEMAAPYKPDAVLVGTFETAGNVITVQARLLDAVTGRIVSVATTDFHTDDDPFTAALMHGDEEAKLDGETQQSTMEIREMAVDETDSTPKMLALKIDQLTREISRNMTRGKPGQMVAVASFVDLDKMNRTNTFGRFLTEGVMDRMARRGFNIVEERTARELMLQPNVGEHLLTREPDELKEGAAADAVVLGTYAIAGDTVTVHARLVLPSSRRVVSVGVFQMNMRGNDSYMKRLFEEPYERVGSNNYAEGVVRK